MHLTHSPKAGQAANIVPDEATALIMFRLIQEPERIADRVVEIVGPRAEVIPGTHNAPIALATVPGFETEVACFNTDIPFFAMPEDSKCYLYGPGSITDAHTANEHIKVADLVDAVDGYVNLVTAALGEMSP